MIKLIGKKRNIQVFFVLLILIGAIGSIVFFPLKLGGSHTCVCDKMICAKETCCMRMNNPGNRSSSATSHQIMNKMPHQHQSELLDRYLFPYGFLWWSSLIVLFSGFYFLKKISRMQTA